MRTAGSPSETGGANSREKEDQMKKPRHGPGRGRSLVLVAALAAAVALAAGFASSAGAYGGGASHDTWQVGISGNCDNPSFCTNDQGQLALRGFWAWVYCNLFATGSITGHPP